MTLFAVRPRFLAASLILGAATSARAGELEIVVACPEWPPEASAQIEARIRTSFLTEGVQPRQVVVSCGPEGTRVEVEGASSSSVRLVEPRSGVLTDDVVAAAQDALHELGQPETSGLATPELEPVPELAPAANPAPSAAPPTPVARQGLDGPPPAEARSPKLTFHVQAGPLLELWDGRGAVGGEAGVFARAPRTLRLGLSLSGRAALGEPESFDATEWSSSARLQLAPTRFAGFQAELGLGASLLVTSPTSNVTAHSSTLIWTASLEARLARPFPVGSFALAPWLGLRVFSGRRDVRVNDQERLLLPMLVPQAGLSLVIPGD